MLLVAEDMAKFSGPPGWRIHQLKGDRAGTWSVSVSGNWRLTFAIESSEAETSTWRTITEMRATTPSKIGMGRPIRAPSSATRSWTSSS